MLDKLHRWLDRFEICYPLLDLFFPSCTTCGAEGVWFVVKHNYYCPDGGDPAYLARLQSDGESEIAPAG